MKIKYKQTHKYLQFIEHITTLIKNKDLTIGDQLASVKILSKTLGLGKDTIIKGLGILMEKGILESVYRKGFFVKKTDITQEFRIFLLFDEFTAYREDIYNSFRDNLKDIAEIEVFFHHNNLKSFKKLIEENLSNYTHFVIITYLNENVGNIFNQLPAGKKIILDYLEEGLKGEFGAVYQDFENDFYNSLVTLQKIIKKYKRIVLINATNLKHDQLRKKACKNFCTKFGYTMVTAGKFDNNNFKMGDLYITIEKNGFEDVAVIKATQQNKWKLGKEVGLLSFDDTIIKEVLEGGISVISTDFKMMGTIAADMIKENKMVQCKNPVKVIIRKSL